MIKEQWSNRNVVQALDGFLEDHAEGQIKPKGKDQRCELFWKLLSSMD